MDAGPGSDTGDLAWFLGTWVVMMAAMMFPSIAPMVVMYSRVQHGKRDRGEAAPAGATAIFVAGYLVSWAAAGMAGWAIFEMGREIAPGAFAWDDGGPYLAGGIIVAAALYQLTPLKDVCLRHCRNPLMFILEHYHQGRRGALQMGVEHGGYCVGCCWALMAALFALGVMSIGWMAFIAALIAIEKLFPVKAVANRGVAIVLLILGLAVAFVPEDVPGLVIPGSPEAMEAMEAMGMEPADESMEEAPMQEAPMQGGSGSGSGGSMESDSGGASMDPMEP